MYQTKSFREKLVCVIVSTFLIFMFVEQLIFVEVFSQLYYLTHAKKITMADFHYKSIKSWKINNIDLTQQSSLSIFTDFHYQSIKITWMLLIFIDNDFYRLSTPGNTYSSRLIKIMHQSIPWSHVYQMMKVLKP